MGVVYEALDTQSGAHVAIKTLRTNAPDSLLRLKREFRALQELAHPNLVRYYELVEESDRWYLSMELVRGCNIRDYLRPDWYDDSSPMPPFDEERLRSAFAQLASALIELHEAGMVHRDLKPSNVLVDQGRVVLLDFGLVVEAHADESWTGDLTLGTAEYMAPEQAVRDELVGPPADWYAVGVMLYEALVHRKPYDTRGVRLLMDKQHKAPAAIESDGRIPDELSALAMRLLSSDPAARPDGRNVIAVLAGSSTARRRSPAKPPAGGRRFVGRAAELATMTSWLPRPGHGPTTIGYLIGESGVGKTALVDQFAAEVAGGDDVAVLRGKCYERETVPFRAVDAIVDAIAQHLKRFPARAAQVAPTRPALLAEAFPVLRGVPVFAQTRDDGVVDPQERRSQMFETLRELLVRLGARVRLLLCIDDLQWVDSDSLALLRRIVQPPGAPSMLLLATWREVDGRTEPPRLPAEARSVRLDRLTRRDAIALAELRLREHPGLEAPAAEMLADEAGGHPLFLDELIRHLGRHPVSSAAYPPSLHQVVRQRVAELPADHRRLVELICVAGRPLSRATLIAACEGDISDLERSIAYLRAARLVRTSRFDVQEAIEPYHDRISSAVQEQFDGARTRQLHLDIARALERSGSSDDAALAHHFSAAGEHIAARDAAERAAVRAVDNLAFDRGVELFRIALRLTDDAGVQRRLQYELGHALAQAGRGVEAAAAFTRAIAGASAEEALDAQWRAAQQWIVTGHVTEGLEALAPVLRARNIRLPTTPRGALWSLARRRAALRFRGLGYRPRHVSEVSPSVLDDIDLYWYVAGSLGAMDPVRANDIQTRALLAALDAGEPHRVARALYAEAAFLAAAGTRARRRVDATLARARSAADPNDPYIAALDLGIEGITTSTFGAFHDGWRLCNEASERLRQVPGATFEASLARAFATVDLMWSGDLVAMRARLGSWLSDSAERGHRYTYRMLEMGPASYLELAADNAERARALFGGHAEQQSTTEASAFFIPELYGLLHAAAAHLYEGDTAGAWQLVTSRDAALGRSLLMRIPINRAMLEDTRGRIAVARACTDHANQKYWLRVAARSSSRIAACAVVAAPAWAALVRAGVEAVRGRTARAVALLERAEKGFTANPMTLHAAAARRQRGALLGGVAGRLLVQEGDAALAAAGVVAPARFAALLAPGFRDG